MNHTERERNIQNARSRAQFELDADMQRERQLEYIQDHVSDFTISEANFLTSFGDAENKLTFWNHSNRQRADMIIRKHGGGR